MITATVETRGPEAMMRPVLVLQFMSDDGPGYLGTWAKREGITLELRNAAAGTPFPNRIDGYSGLAVLGGAMSANDDLQYLRRAELLILQAIDSQVPVVGHCLGGQLMARALGARVQASPAPEVGWHRLDVLDLPDARAWFGPESAQHVFHWHYEAFDIPAGATRLAGSPACANQAFAVGPHLAMQFHVEIDTSKVNDWLRTPDDAYARAQQQPTVQKPDDIRRGMQTWLEAHHRLADCVYRHWRAGMPSIPR
jgi:GMP synthase-like glutamine amidotransferase